MVCSILLLHSLEVFYPGSTPWYYPLLRVCFPETYPLADVLISGYEIIEITLVQAASSQACSWKKISPSLLGLPFGFCLGNFISRCCGTICEKPASKYQGHPCRSEVTLSAVVSCLLGLYSLLTSYVTWSYWSCSLFQCLHDPPAVVGDCHYRMHSLKQRDIEHVDYQQIKPKMKTQKNQEG